MKFTEAQLEKAFAELLGQEGSLSKLLGIENIKNETIEN